MTFPDWFLIEEDEVRFLRRLLDHVSDCLVLVDTEGRIALINEPYCRLLGGKQDDFIGRHITGVASPDTKLHRVAKGELVVRGAPLEAKGHKLFTRQVPVYQSDRIIGALGMALFNSLDALQTAAATASQQVSAKDSRHGWVARHTLDDIAGIGTKMETLRGRIEQAAAQSQPVLIQGESGTGKDLAAHALHACSSRSRRPFVWINCASIPESLIESELFGYESGAFTGASSRGQRGKFELANGGTLFLDEIGDMPAHLQASLLNAIQNQVIVRVGGVAPIPIDTRIVCATNRPLDEMVREGTFRLDLYYRLNVLNIRMPALRERDDLEYLIDHLLKRIARREQCPLRELPAPVLSTFLAFSWPGNVRQLEAILLRFLISNEADLDDEIPVNGAKSLRDTEVSIEDVQQDRASLNLQEYLDRQRELQIRRALDLSSNNRDEAARLLGISRATLYRELRRAGLAAP
jgi:transcriptional regulator with PAS, ATPase and Fis domain